MTDYDPSNEPTAPFEPLEPVEPMAPHGVAFSGPVRTSSGRSIAVRAGMLAGSAVLVVIGAVAAMGASPAPATGADPTAGTNATPAPDASKAPGTIEPGKRNGPPNGSFPGFGLGGGGIGGFGGVGGFGLGRITVTSVNGSDVSLKTDDGWTRTITVTGTTTITKAGATIKVGDLVAGDKVRFSEDRAADGTYSVTAIVVVLPTVVGQVSTINGDTLTVTQPGGTTATIHVSGSTTYQVNGAKGSLSDVKVGSFIVAEGTQRTDGSLDAAAVHLGLAGRGGAGGPSFPFPGFPGGHRGPNTNASPAPSGTTG
jgi:hypothetical protein